MWFALGRRARTARCHLLFSCLLFTCVRAYAVDEQDDSSNITYVAPHSEHIPSMFSPRMDFEQWKPLTGRGDPLQNDPTYDYDPPKLDRVHYWIDPAAAKPDEKIKSEVLVLGVSSKKPSVVQPNIKRDDIGGVHKYMTKIPNYMHYPFSRPNIPPRHRPTSQITFPTQSNKVRYEDYSYKITDSNPIPMTILVPPPPPQPGQVQSTFYELVNEQQQQPQNLPSTSESTSYVTTSTTPTPTEQGLPETSPSLFVQEANLIYQSSTVDNNWDYSVNASNEPSEPTVNSDYAGWGPTVSPELEESNNDTQNLINSDHFEIIHHPYSFYKPMFSEAPPPLQPGAIFEHSSQITELPTLQAFSESVTPSQQTSTPITPPPNSLTTEFKVTETVEVSTERQKIFEPTPLPPVRESEQGIFAMLEPMLGMPMTDGPQRPEDNLYAHGTENVHVFKQPTMTQEAWEIELESMQTMQPPPVTVTTERMPVNYQHNLPTRPPGPGFLQTLLYIEKSPLALTSGTMKYPIFKPVAQTPPTTTTVDPVLGRLKIPSDMNAAPMYLIIQGHSKVKTYGSKSKGALDLKDAIDNEIPQLKEPQQVKHLHPLKLDRDISKSEVKRDKDDRSKNGRSLKKLVSDGVGKIEIQEANLGIQYDVSDGSGVPVEIYRKGFVDTEENDYSKSRKNKITVARRRRRQLDLEDILPIDEENIEEYVYNYLKNKSREKSLTGLIAAAVTSDAAEAVDELEPDEDEEDEAEDERR